MSADDRQSPGSAVGYIVLIPEYGRWTDTWDGMIHTEKQKGLDELGMAVSAGYKDARLGVVHFAKLTPRQVEVAYGGAPPSGDGERA